ncbi:MAG TPA: ABC transporter substrate-binding protein [Thermomicrobiales bacterium]|nr:ABC transporter substrate-binding protein [Thermomicrobiales bacterium]
MDGEDTGPTIPRRSLLRGAALGAAVVTASAFEPVVSLLGRRAAAQEATEVRITGAPSSPEESRLLEQVLQDFEAKFPDIRVVWEPVPQQYAEKLQTDLAAGTAADVFYVDSLLAPDLAARGVLLPLDEPMAAAGVRADDFYAGLIEAFQWDGRTYGLPKDWSSLAMVYDPQAFDRAGISTPPTTWDELRSVAQTLLDATGQAPIILPPDFARFIVFLYQGGGTVIGADGSVAIDSPQTQQALDYYYGLYADGLAATPADVGAQWPGDAFAKDLGIIVFEGNWMFPFLEASAPDKQFLIAELPAGPAGKVTMGFTVSYSINAKTTVAEPAWELVNYLTGPEGMAKWTDLGLAMPSRPDLAEAWIAKYPEREPYLAGGAFARPWQLGPGGQAFYQDANAILEAVFAGQTEIPDAATQLAEKAAADIKIT